MNQKDNEINLPLQFSSFNLWCATVADIIMEVAHENGTNPQELPKNWISHILSFATPRDICRLSAVSKDFRSAGNNDSVWDKFLPLDQIPRKAVTPFPPSSKKQLYFHLCDSILIDKGRKRLFLEWSTGKNWLRVICKRIIHCLGWRLTLLALGFLLWFQIRGACWINTGLLVRFKWLHDFVCGQCVQSVVSA